MARTEFIRVRVTPEEKEAVSKKAQEASRPISEYVRASLLGYKLVVLPGLEDTLLELRRIGNNLNQITLLARQGRAVIFSLEELKKEVNNIWRSLNSSLPSRR